MAKKNNRATSIGKIVNSRTKPAVLNKFTGYTPEDCSCEYCLYYGSKKRGCLVSECCCAEEKAEAARRRKQ